MAKTPRARYPQELKQQAVSMAVEDNFGVSETARRLSIPLKTLANWVAQYRQDKWGRADMTQQDGRVQKTRRHTKPGGILFVHIVRVVFLGFVLGPLTATLSLFFEEPAVTLPSAVMAGLIFGVLSVAGWRFPSTSTGRYILPLCFAWVLLPALSPFFFMAMQMH